MFGNRRRRGSSNPPPPVYHANPSATTAAASAFLKSQTSNASLSSAAAAAALRSRPTTPVSVGDVQTKRMLRRAGSNSSVGSSAAGSTRGPPGATLERRGSSGSMSERTFRDPSPARAVPGTEDAPPVPAIPKSIARTASAAHRRTASLEAPAMRVASPPPSRATGRGSSLGPTITATPLRGPGSRISGLSSVPELTGVERPASRGSVNFSLPTSSRPTSPVSQRQLTSPLPQRTNPQRITSPSNSNLVYDPNTRSFLPLAEILAIEQRIQNASNAPAKKKKKAATKHTAGTHFRDSTVGGRLRGTAIDQMEQSGPAPPMDADSSVRIQSPLRTSESAPTIAASTVEPTAALRKKNQKAAIASDSDSDQQSYVPNSSDNESEFSSPPSIFHTRAGALLAKKPSIVREDIEPEEEQDDTPRPGVEGRLKLDTTPRTVSPSPLPHSSAGRGHGKGQASASAAFAQARQYTRSASQPPPAVATLDATSNPADENGLAKSRSVRGGRVHSVSPARATHFAATPDLLAVRHSPPPRSISPRKSALKQSLSDSPRGQSPTGGAKFGSNLSETSNGSPVEYAEQPPPKKRAFRVSFDENNVVVGQAAGLEISDSPIMASPQHESAAKRGWLSLTGRGKKKETVTTEGDDEVMQPRPTLPSFGSIRERKQTREPVEERPLVKPVGAVGGGSLADDLGEPSSGQSNDHIAGAIIAQDAASKNTANTSKSREPLPPQVTTVDGSGYLSGSDDGNNRDDTGQLDTGAATSDGALATSAVGRMGMLADAPADGIKTNDNATNGGVPAISVSGATPTPEESDKQKEWPNIPGGWSRGTNSSESQHRDGIPNSVEHRILNPTPATIGIAEPLPDEARASSPVSDHIVENSQEHPTLMEETEESEGSIYSDAAEDLSDVEGGFMSLDAVVESPATRSTSPGLTTTTAPDSPTARTVGNGISMEPHDPGVDGGWEKAQEYWGSLSAERKRQLEQEAIPGTEASKPPHEAPKPVSNQQEGEPATPPARSEGLSEPQHSGYDRTYMISPGSKASVGGYIPAMRSSMRAEPPIPASETHMRRSMRAQGVIRNSLRDSPQMSQQRGSLVKKNRPVSLPTSEIKADSDAVRRHIKTLSGANSNPSVQAPIPLRRNSGDSDSSFKRTKASENTTFTRSLRSSVDNAPGGQNSPPPSSRFSLRSLSPAGSATGRGSHLQNPIRTSMRKAEPTKSPMRILGFGRAPSQPAKGKPSRQRVSRFADSSDEEDARPAFQSRFADSSDDDDAPPPPRIGGGFGRGSMRAAQPVRGIPRRAGVEDGDSSDLPDSDDEQPPSWRNKSTNKQNGSPKVIPNQGGALSSVPLRRSGSGRDAGTPISPASTTSARPRGGNLMSILRRKKPDPSSKVRKADIESAARRDTPLERSRTDLQAVRSNSYGAPGEPKQAQPRLQKRNANTAWPLPPPEPQPVAVAVDGRPRTADGGDEMSPVDGSTTRPELGARSYTAQGLPGEIDVTGVGKGPKKKFGALRRMFRLDD